MVFKAHNTWLQPHDLSRFPFLPPQNKYIEKVLTHTGALSGHLVLISLPQVWRALSSLAYAFTNISPCNVQYFHSAMHSTFFSIIFSYIFKPYLSYHFHQNIFLDVSSNEHSLSFHSMLDLPTEEFIPLCCNCSLFFVLNGTVGVLTSGVLYLLPPELSTVVIW